MIKTENFYLTQGVTKHIIITDFSVHMKNHQDGCSIRYNANEYLLISDSISELVNILNSHPSSKIQSKDKIYFSVESLYPSLLLSRLVSQYKVDVSRTITESKATKFIFNKNPILTYFNDRQRWSSLNEIHLTGCSGTSRILCKIPNLTDKVRLDFMKSSLEKLYNCQFYYGASIKNHDTAQLYIDHLNEAVDTRELTRYVNTFIPEATDQEIDTVFNFMKSSDPGIRKTGISLFTTMNVSSKLYNVIKKACDFRLNNAWAIPSQLNSSWNYFLQYIDCTLEELYYNFNSRQSYFLRKIMQNPIYTGDMESIKGEIKKLLLERLSSGSEFQTLREDLELINCEIVIHDKNREATSGN